MSSNYCPSSPENNQVPTLPPYNTLNFTNTNQSIHSTLVNYAKTQPQYPLPSGSSPDQLRELQKNVTYYTNINERTIEIKRLNQTIGGTSAVPYPQFRSEKERLMYRQGLVMSAARNVITGENPSLPAGVPVSTLYQIINSD